MAHNKKRQNVTLYRVHTTHLSPRYQVYLQIGLGAPAARPLAARVVTLAPPRWTIAVGREAPESALALTGLIQLTCSSCNSSFTILAVPVYA